MKKGFTFIEILVVITIIGVLTLIGVTNFRVANQKARDGRRQADLEQIRAALELYRSDEAVYPTTAEGLAALTDGATVYLNEAATDPLSAYTYSYTSDGLTYSLCAALELTTATVTGCGDCGNGESITCNYKVTNPL